MSLEIPLAEKINAEQIITPKVVELVRLYVLTMAYHRAIKQRTDAIYAAVLQEMTILYSAENREHAGERITNKEDLYMADLDSQEISDYYAECHRRMVADGVKPKAMNSDHCPALVSGNMAMEVQHELADVAGKPLGIDAERILTRGRFGMMDQFTDLVCKLVHSRHPIPAPTPTELKNPEFMEKWLLGKESLLKYVVQPT